MSHKNYLSACIKWRAGNANGGRFGGVATRWKIVKRHIWEEGEAGQGGAGRQIALQAVGAIEGVVVLSLCQIQLGLIGVRES